MQIKSTVSYLSTPIKLSSIRDGDITNCWQGRKETALLPAMVVGIEDDVTTVRNSLAIFHKNSTFLPPNTETALLVTKARKWKPTFLQKPAQECTLKLWHSVGERYTVWHMKRIVLVNNQVAIWST